MSLKNSRVRTKKCKMSMSSGTNTVGGASTVSKLIWGESYVKGENWHSEAELNVDLQEHRKIMSLYFQRCDADAVTATRLQD